MRDESYHKCIVPPRQIAVILALSLYLVLGVTSSVIQDFLDFDPCPSPDMT